MKPTTIRFLLFNGLIIPIIFWGSTIIGSILHGNYNHFRNTISELGAIGSHSERFMTISTWICTALSVVFLVGLLKVCRQFKLSIMPLIGILGFSITFGWAAIFHSGNSMHSKAGPAMLLLLMGPLLSATIWKWNNLKKLKMFSWVSLFSMSLILLRAIPLQAIQNNYTGLIQRFVHLGWTIWFISLSLTFMKAIKNNFNSPKADE